MDSKEANILIKNEILSLFAEEAFNTKEETFSSNIAWTVGFSDNSNTILNYIKLPSSLSGILTGTCQASTLDKEINEVLSFLPFNIECNGLIISVDFFDKDRQEETVKAINSQLQKSSVFLNKSILYTFVKKTEGNNKEFQVDDIICLKAERNEMKVAAVSFDKQETALFELSKQYFGIVTAFSIPVVKDSVYSELQNHNIAETGIKNSVLNFRNTDLLFSFNGEEIVNNKDKLKDTLKAIKQTARKSKDEFTNFLSFIPIQEATLLFPKTSQRQSHPNGIIFEKKETVLSNEFELFGYFRYDGDLGKDLIHFGEYIDHVVNNIITSQLKSTNNAHSQSILTFVNNYTGCGITLPFRNTNDENNSELRKQYHSRFHLPMDKPLLRACDSLYITRKTIELDTSGKLRDVHYGLNAKGVPGGKKYVISGSYIYYHYMQDGFDDQGWGCTYRSLQTVLSWFKVQKLVPDFKIPTIPEIQKILVDMNDKPENFFGSKERIGAIEVNLVLNKLLDIESKILFISSGAEIPSKARELKDHFINEGTPIMIGGGVLAYTLLGIDYNEETGDIKFLILDPHYTGSDNLKNIQDKGWIGWKESKLFVDSAFYNFCLPQRKKVI